MMTLALVLAGLVGSATVPAGHEEHRIVFYWWIFPLVAFIASRPVQVSVSRVQPRVRAGLPPSPPEPRKARWLEIPGGSNRMRHIKVMIAGGVAAVLVAGTGAGIAAASGGDDSEGPITGQALDRAGAAALEETGGGRVTETEVGDEDSYYEVEVTLDDGSQVDVQLDASFQVVGSSADEDHAGDDNDAGGQ